MQEKNSILSFNDQLSGDALRVLSFVMIPLTEGDLKSLRELEEADDRLTYLLKGPMVMLGLLGFLDPPRVGVKEAIQECNEAGVAVIMITGDQRATATAIGKSIGLLHG